MSTQLASKQPAHLDAESDARQIHAPELASSTSMRHLVHDLTIVIPALNEEESIQSTVHRCLEARSHIRSMASIDRIEIIVVSDGSTDRTIEYAQQLAEEHDCVSLIIFEKNQGYGAAIKAGFEQGQGDLVAFLDADGTCDPRYFGAMCREIDEQQADIVLGSRMGENSEMPKVRRVGNRIFATLLGALSGRSVEDTASGMRVIRRSALKQLYPLPNGLHFTPAMSARAMMAEIPLVEIPMNYAERVGESKLRVVKDGFRFLRAIMEAMLLFRPGRLFAFASALCFMIALGWGLYPVEYYLRNRSLEEWMIYRVLLCGFLLTSSFVLLSAAGFADRFLTLMRYRRNPSFVSSIIAHFTAPVSLAAITVLGGTFSMVLVAPGLLEYLRTGHVTLHWSRVVSAVFLLQMALASVINLILQYVVGLWGIELRKGSKNG